MAGDFTWRNRLFPLLGLMDILAALMRLQRHMAVQLFSLRGVPDDEADEIRALLQEHAIDFYETPAGNWGMSMPALWLRDEGRLEQARALIEQYQQQRLRQIHQESPPRSVMEMIRDQPLRYVAYLALIAVVLYFSISPFFKLGRG